MRKPEAELSRLGRRLQGSVRRMSGLIDDVLDFARGRLGSGIGIARQATGDLGQLFDNVVTELQDTHPTRLIESRIAIEGDVVCDSGRLQQLLSNLLGNALSHGDPALPIVVDVQVVGEVLEIAVANGGDPIPAELQGKVFEPYWRPPTSVPGGGLGLGLYICAQIVKAHGGGLAVTSSAANGTRFVAQIPTV